MPKTPFTTTSFPLSGLFGIIKPSGPTSMSIVNDLQRLITRSRLFVDAEKLELLSSSRGTKKAQMHRRKAHQKGTVKVGQGGTLDPLADGVLVIGVGKGTKRLNEFLNCTKEYRTTCLLGCETDTYDCEGSRVRVAPWRHVSQKDVEASLEKFIGKIKQTPPIFSALKMDGKPLYEYARNGIPLPRPIEPREVTVHVLKLEHWLGAHHPFSWPQKEFSTDEKKALETALKSVVEDDSAAITNEDHPELSSPTSDDVAKPSAFTLNMKVSGGTYVRSIVHDLAHQIGSAGHVVTLTRTRQGKFVLDPSEVEAVEAEERDRACIPWQVFERALRAEDGEGETETEMDGDGWTEWEREVMQHLEVV